VNVMRQIPLPLQTRPQPRLDNFEPGPAAGPNALALASLRAWRPPTAPVPPMYLWGPSGSGKSHLLRALAAQARAWGGTTLSVAAGQPLPWSVPAGCALVTIDDIERLTLLEQHAAFALMVEAATLALCVAAAGAWPPVDLPLREDLRTRLGWGTVLALEPLDEASTRAVLQREAHRRSVGLPEDVLSYLMTHESRDLKHLFGWLDRLDEFSLAHQRHITLPMLRAMAADEAADEAAS
jgi:DnaA-homolog protein